MDKSKRFVWITNQSTILPISKPPSHSQGTPKKLLVKLMGQKDCRSRLCLCIATRPNFLRLSVWSVKSAFGSCGLSTIAPVPDRLVLNSKPQHIDAMMNWEDPLYRKIVDALPANSTAQRLHHQPRCQGGGAKLIARLHQQWRRAPRSLTFHHA